MSGYPGRRRGHGGSGGGGGGGPDPVGGLFTNGGWHCDCSPRERAVHFETKKTGSAPARNPKAHSCGFFLWDDQAQLREQPTLLHNARPEPRFHYPTTPTRHRSSPPTPNSVEGRSFALSRKRARPLQNDSDSHGLEQAKDRGRFEPIQTFDVAETPSKAAKTSELATPATARRKLPWQMDQLSAGTDSPCRGLQTPQTERKATGETPVSVSPMASAFLFTPSATSASVCNTPTPIRSNKGALEDLVNDVFGMIYDTNTRLSSHVQTELRALLLRHARKAEGYKRGRDVMRMTVQAREVKLVDLNFRVKVLEEELEAERAMVKRLQREAQTGPTIT